jgi:hypothetical protein
LIILRNLLKNEFAIPAIVTTFRNLEVITMTLNTFWKIFLKVFALYLIWQLLLVLPTVFSSIVYLTRNDKMEMFTIFSGLLCTALVFIAIIRYCLFQSDRVIDKLRLTKGFTDEKLEINIHRSSLLTIIVIVLGCLMIANSLPLFIFNIFSYIQRSDNTMKFQDNPSTPYLVSDFLKVIIGYFIATESRLVVNFIERNRKASVATVEDEVVE